MSFSLRELLLLVFVASFGLAALSIQSWLAALALMLAILLLMGLVIVALVGQGDWRTFAIGFVAAAICYATIIWLGRDTELNPWDGQLLTTNALAPIFNAMNKRTWVDPTTQKVVANYVPPPPPKFGISFGVPGAPISRNSHDPTSFTRTGQVLFTLLFGYLGGKFAVCIQRRGTLLRAQETQSQPTK